MIQIRNSYIVKKKSDKAQDWWRYNLHVDVMFNTTLKQWYYETYKKLNY